MNIYSRLSVVRLLLLGLSIFTLPAFSSEPETGGDATTPVEFIKRPEVREFIQTMHEKHGFDTAQLQKWFTEVHPRPDIIAAISNPAEAKPWHYYRKIFLTDTRIRGGIEFWDQHADLLARAEKQSGVPARILVAILGVETLYATRFGKHPVLESLATLAFDYPKRATFFRGELEQFLLLAREEQVDPLQLRGSYAGAMGGPQFISSSFRRYAVDFDQDGKRDIWGNPADMIGSVANYFEKHGWVTGMPIATMATVQGDRYEKILDIGLKPEHPLSELAKYGITPKQAVEGDPKAALISLETENGNQYWLGMQNFYVITRYNHSALYAMAVYQLSESIAAGRTAGATAHPAASNAGS